MPACPSFAQPAPQPAAGDASPPGPSSPGRQPVVVVAGGGIVGTAVAHALQGPCQVILVDDGDFPGLAETRHALGILRATYGHPVLDEYAAATWRFAVTQHEHPRSPVRLRWAALDGRPGRAAFLDHLLLLDALLLRARKGGCRLLTRTRVTGVHLRGGRVAGARIRPAPGGSEADLPADAVVLAPGPRPDTLALDGLPGGFADRFTRVKDVVVPFRLPAGGGTAGGARPPHGGAAGPEASGDAGREDGDAQVITRRSLVWRFATGLEAGVLHAAARFAGDWAPPSFEELVALVEDLYDRFHLPGEAEIDRARTLIDLAGPGGLPFAGPVAPLGGAEGLFVAAGLGLEGLSLSVGVAQRVARAVLEDLGLPSLP